MAPGAARERIIANKYNLSDDQIIHHPGECFNDNHFSDAKN